jgi:hypothetical protein
MIESTEGKRLHVSVGNETDSFFDPLDDLSAKGEYPTLLLYERSRMRADPWTCERRRRQGRTQNGFPENVSSIFRYPAFPASRILSRSIRLALKIAVLVAGSCLPSATAISA